jgi:hypothetical protein
MVFFPKVLAFFWEITNIWQSLETFGLVWLFVIFLNPLAAMDFPMDFWLFCIYYIAFVVLQITDRTVKWKTVYNFLRFVHDCGRISQYMSSVSAPSPPPPPPAGECCPSPFGSGGGGGDTLACRRGGAGSRFGRMDRHSGALGIV